MTHIDKVRAVLQDGIKPQKVTLAALIESIDAAILKLWDTHEPIHEIEVDPSIVDHLIAIYRARGFECFQEPEDDPDVSVIRFHRQYDENFDGALKAILEDIKGREGP